MIDVYENDTVEITVSTLHLFLLNSRALSRKYSHILLWTPSPNSYFPLFSDEGDKSDDQRGSDYPLARGIFTLRGSQRIVEKDVDFDSNLDSRSHACYAQSLQGAHAWNSLLRWV